MGYINDLRQLVGHRPLILVGATALLFDAAGRLLLLHRTDNHCWGPPGGGSEPGESLEETARRETHEETGLQAGTLELYAVFSGPELFYEYPNGDQVHNVTVVYVCRDYFGDLSLDPGEHTGAGFFDLSDLPDPVSPPVIPVFRRLLADRVGYDTLAGEM